MSSTLRDELPDEMIRERAHHIWEREGRPEGRADEHWQMARTELAVERGPDVATRPNPVAEGREAASRSEPVEPQQVVENQGSVPGLADQDEEGPTPPRLGGPQSQPAKPRAKPRAKRGGGDQPDSGAGPAPIGNP